MSSSAAAPLARTAWQPGQSGNPGGRPKSAKLYSDACRAILAASPWGSPPAAWGPKRAAWTTAQELAMRDVETALRKLRKGKRSVRLLELLVEDREAALTRILDRAEGRPIQGVEHGLEEHFLDDVAGARAKLTEALTLAAAKALPAITVELVPEAASSPGAATVPAAGLDQAPSPSSAAGPPRGDRDDPAPV